MDSIMDQPTAKAFGDYDVALVCTVVEHLGFPTIFRLEPAIVRYFRSLTAEPFTGPDMSGHQAILTAWLGGLFHAGTAILAFRAASCQPAIHFQ
jgi:hypothetical protein